MENGIVKMASKYLDKPISKSSFSDSFSNSVSSFQVSKFDEAEVSTDHAIIKLKSGQVVNVSEDSLLYDQLKDLVLSNDFLRIDGYRFINKNQIAEFIDISEEEDFSTKDIEKEDFEEDINPNWKELFGDDE